MDIPDPPVHIMPPIYLRHTCHRIPPFYLILGVDSVPHCVQKGRGHNGSNIGGDSGQFYATTSRGGGGRLFLILQLGNMVVQRSQYRKFNPPVFLRMSYMRCLHHPPYHGPCHKHSGPPKAARSRQDPPYHIPQNLGSAGRQFPLLLLLTRLIGQDAR